MVLIMINTTISGLVFTAVAADQMPQYWTDPNGYISDLKAMQVEPAYGVAIVQHIDKVAENGRDFVEDVARVSSWYDPKMGNNIDIWA